MATAVKMYEAHPSFFSSTNEYKSGAEVNNLYVLDHSFPIVEFSKEVIFIIAEYFPAKPLLNLRTTSLLFFKTLAKMPKMVELERKITDRMLRAFLEEQQRERARRADRLDRRA